MGEQALAVQLKPTVGLCSLSRRPQDVVLGYKVLLSHSPPWQGGYREGQGECSRSSESWEAAEATEKARGQDGGGGAGWGREPPMGQFYWCIYLSWEDFNGFIWEGLYAAFLFVPSLVNDEEVWQWRQNGGSQSLSLQSSYKWPAWSWTFWTPSIYTQNIPASHLIAPAACLLTKLKQVSLILH